uniref:Putative nucleoprotein n=1 Tax=Hubei diptera virus 7 TaxID=1922888 RepID=A0A1L3KPI7_9VIRU|nr:putative nucleoprotein [Hubei diptera virus 7]
MSISKITQFTDRKNHVADPTANTSAVASLNLIGTLPDELTNMRQGGDYLLEGMSAKDLIDQYLGVAFDMTDLVSQMIMVIPDFTKDITMTDKSKSLQFAADIIYNVGPEARKVKKPDNDKVWKYRIMDSGVAKCIFVSTYKNTEPPKAKPQVVNNKLCLTIKQAGLLAVFTLTRVIPVCVPSKNYLLTPLAGAVFSRNDILDLARDIHRKNDPTDAEVSQLLIDINQSCQSGGQYLMNSTCEMAQIAAICATRNLKDIKLKSSIINKITNQYFSAGKLKDKNRFLTIAKYARGGVPTEESFDKIVAIYDEVQSKPRGLKALSQDFH